MPRKTERNGVITAGSKSAENGASKPLSSVDGSRWRISSKPPRRPEAGLYIVATPIGNAGDITLRALDVLSAADVIACEDTRVTRKLLSIHGIAPSKLIAYNEHNADIACASFIEHLESGFIVALVYDAGTPMINDPGYRIAEACRSHGLAVHAIPGASAVINGLVLAGLPTDRFMYCGFPPPKQGKRRTWLGAVRDVQATLVFLESPNRLAASLADMAEVLGTRPAAVLREMTKKFEEARRGSLAELAAHYAEAGPPKGEVTLVVGSPDEDTDEDMDVEGRLRAALATESVREASARIAAETGQPKRDIYALALAIKSESET